MHDVRVLRLPHDQMPRNLTNVHRGNNFYNSSISMSNVANNHINNNLPFYSVNNHSKEIPLLPYKHINENYSNNRSPTESPPLIKKQLKSSVLNGPHPLHNNNVNVMNSSSKDTDSLNDRQYYVNGVTQHELSKSLSTNVIDHVKKLTPSQQVQHLGKENNKSILKKSFPQLIQLRNTEDWQGTQKDRPRSVPCAPRKVDFRPSVLVFLFDRNEGGHVRSESQDLTTEPKDRKKFLIRNNSPIKQKLFQNGNGIIQTNTFDGLDSSTVHIVLPQGTKHFIPKRLPRGSLTDDDLQIKSYIPGLVYRSDTPTHYLNNKITTHNNSHVKDMNNNNVDYDNKKVNQNGNPMSIVSNQSISSPPPLPSPPLLVSSKTSPSHLRQRTHSLTSDYNVKLDDAIPTININDVEFVFFEDENCRLWLRFVLDLGFGISAADVLVKANLAGNKVRIVGTRLKNGALEEFNERCTLPMEVDPYMIIARMDNNGKLFVEGLIMTPDRKNFLSRQQKLK